MQLLSRVIRIGRILEGHARTWGGRRAASLAVIGLIALGPLAPLANAGPFADPGHTAEAMLSWASEVAADERGPMDIAAPESGLASVGVAENALGEADASVYSLGDGGSITLYFENGIGDGPEDDFAVFENGFFAPSGLFAEFAFVDISSNGVDFARFSATSLQDTAVSSFGAIDPSDYQNLAGDQPAGVGTGFDLAEFAGHDLVAAGLLDLGAVHYVRLVDVIGDGSTTDADGFPVYDPYPTAFASGGFDLEAVGVLHEAPEPAGTSLLLAGLAGLVCASRRRRRLASCVA